MKFNKKKYKVKKLSNKLRDLIIFEILWQEEIKKDPYLLECSKDPDFFT